MNAGISDGLARGQTRFFRFLADKFFAGRYGHRAVALETIAGVPGMVAGMWIHVKSLRQMKTGYGPMIRELLAEAENERMHLMFFIEIAKPNMLERLLILAAQAIFWNYYFFSTFAQREQPILWFTILRKRQSKVIQTSWRWWITV